MGRRLVAYIRVSSINQATNTSLESQLSEIKRYCEFKGHELIAIYQDVDSGKNMGRDEFTKAIDHVFNGDADGIAVWSLDRFARKAVRAWQIIAELDDAGKDLVIVNRDLDTSGPTGKMIRNILLAVGEYEHALLHERCAKGREAKKQSGGYAGGQPRFGWRAVKGKVEPVASEQWTLKVLSRFRALGVSSYRCAQYLNLHERHATKKGGQWTHRTVERVLNAQDNATNGYQLYAIEGGKSGLVSETNDRSVRTAISHLSARS